AGFDARLEAGAGRRQAAADRLAAESDRSRLAARAGARAEAGGGGVRRGPRQQPLVERRVEHQPRASRRQRGIALVEAVLVVVPGKRSVRLQPDGILRAAIITARY